MRRAVLIKLSPFRKCWDFARHAPVKLEAIDWKKKPECEAQLAPFFKNNVLTGRNKRLGVGMRQEPGTIQNLL